MRVGLADDGVRWARCLAEFMKHTGQLCGLTTRYAYIDICARILVCIILAQFKTNDRHISTVIFLSHAPGQLYAWSSRYLKDCCGITEARGLLAFLEVHLQMCKRARQNSTLLLLVVISIAAMAISCNGNGLSGC